MWSSGDTKWAPVTFLIFGQRTLMLVRHVSEPVCNLFWLEIEV